MEVAMNRKAIRYTLSALAVAALVSAFAADPASSQQTRDIYNNIIFGNVAPATNAGGNNTATPKGLTTEKRPTRGTHPWWLGVNTFKGH
jgi:hypothetical protein